jgi:N6-L-threonylcarbamoyladenine synthase
MRLARLACTLTRRRGSTRSLPAAPAAWRRDGVVLGIESSCDDTGVALVTGDGRVLGSALTTQVGGKAGVGGGAPNSSCRAS